MKRTLLEITCGLGVLVLLASFHHQLSRLRTETKDVPMLRELVADAVAKAGSKDDLSAIRRELTKQLERKLEDLETKVASAAHGSDEAKLLRQQFAQAKQEVEQMKAEVARDASRTKELVDAYGNEMRAKESRTEATVKEASQELKSLAGRVVPDPERLTREMLAPTVQLNGEDTVGSGTLIWSGTNTKTKQVESYVLTSYHVIRNILADCQKARREGIAVTIYTESGKSETQGDMIAHDEKIDAALLKLRSDKVWPRTARVMPLQEAQAIKVWDPVYAVGCPLGNDPIPTRGEVASTKNELNGTNYWMINAPTYFGNSGGGIYRGTSHELVGVFSKIYTHGKTTPVVVPHMGLCTPITAVHEWLGREKLAFVLECPPQLDAQAQLATPPK
jgi:S1-C subfamily serine protease